MKIHENISLVSFTYIKCYITLKHFHVVSLLIFLNSELFIIIKKTSKQSSSQIRVMGYSHGSHWIARFLYFYQFYPNYIIFCKEDNAKSM